MSSAAALAFSASKKPGSLPEPSRVPYFVGEPLEESRQHYANERIQEWQRQRVLSQMPVTFAQLLHVFVLAGKMYDSGCRLRDERLDGAA